MWSSLFFFFCLCFWYPKKSLLNLMLWSFLPMFSCKIFIVLGLTFKSLIRFRIFLFLYDIRYGFSLIFFFSFGYPVFLATPVEKTVLSFLNGLDSLVKSHSIIYVSICFCPLYFIPLVCMSVSCPYHTVSITVALR